MNKTKHSILLNCSLSLVFILLSSISGFSQRENFLWLFGSQNLGIQFDYKTKQPSVISGKYTPYSTEGCSVICDPSTGKLLYYSDGIRVIDATNSIMPNGAGLLGDISSAQNGWSCPVPGQCNKYYIFSNNSAYERITSGDLHYSIVDMTLPGNGTVDNPLGDIEAGAKSKLVVSNTSEAISIVKSSIRNEYWLLVPIAGSSKISVFKISTSGVINTGTFDTGVKMVDMRNIRYSEKAGKFAIVGMYGLDPVLIIDFDNTTGQISNPVIVPGTPQANTAILYKGAYDAEWSPDGTKLYYSMYHCYPNSNEGKLMQYDLNNKAAPAVILYSLIGTVRGLKLGPDGRIYLLHNKNNTTRYIGTINDPNKAGILCNFDPKGLDMGQDLGNAHKFPNFLVYDNQAPQAKDDIYTATCISASDTILTVLGNDNDPDNDPLSVSVLGVTYGTASVLPNKQISYTQPSSLVTSDTIYYKICDDFCNSLCDSAKVIICINNCAISFDTLIVDSSACNAPTGFAEVSTGTNTTLYQYSWDNGSFGTSSTISNLNAGSHKITIQKAGTSCKIKIPFVVPAKPIEYTKIITNEICKASDGSIIVHVNNPSATIQWIDGNNSFNRSGLSAGDYTFDLSIPGFPTCKAEGILTVEKNNKTIPVDFTYSSQTLDSSGRDFLVDFNNFSTTTGISFWTFGDGNTSSDVNPTHNFKSGTYEISLTVSDKKGCQGKILKQITLKYLAECAVDLPDAFSPNEDGMNDKLAILGFAPEVELKIFNRWGEVIFVITGLTEEWDGTYRHEQVPGGVYPYILNYKCPIEGKVISQQTKVGEILLVR